MWRKIIDPLLTLAYPQTCHCCGQSVEESSDGVVCRSCWKKTPVLSGRETICHKCGAFLSERPAAAKTFCHRCDGDFYDRAVAAGFYRLGLSASILHLKREPVLPERVRRIFLKRFETAGFPDLDLIIPVPLSRRRFRERGFNQAGIPAGILARKTGLHLDELSLVRRADTPVHRAGMDRKARAMSVENAFAVKRERFIEGRKVLLVDDVYTSGATVSNCAGVLRKAGAECVFVLTLARAD
ncbi:MAG: double zinc ribbon domain-containing protein [Pyrinomonadaceae bacterium]